MFHKTIKGCGTYFVSFRNRCQLGCLRCLVLRIRKTWLKWSKRDVIYFSRVLRVQCITFSGRFSFFFVMILLPERRVLQKGRIWRSSLRSLAFRTRWSNYFIEEVPTCQVLQVELEVLYVQLHFPVKYKCCKWFKKRHKGIGFI